MLKLSIVELASVVGGGTGAQTPTEAAKNYLFNNGNGSWLQQAGAFGSKVGHRAQYSFGFINYQTYANHTEAAPGGRDYVEDMRRLRPSGR